MAKITLTDLTSLANDTSAVNSLNENFTAIESYINDNVLSRDAAGETNTILNDLDFNSYDILNVTDINGEPIGNILSGATTASVAAAASEAAAAISETNAAASETAAGISETNAATSETNAAVSETNAAASAASVDVTLTQTNAWTVAQVNSTQTTSVTGSTTLDFDTYSNFVLTLTGNITLANPTTENIGQSGFIVFKQDGTGTRTLTLGSQYLTAGGAVPTLTSTANAIDIIGYAVAGDGEILLGSALLEFA